MDFKSGFYRVYKSGWCEQGGYIQKTSGQNVALPIQLLKEMDSVYYEMFANPILGGGDTTAHLDCVNTSTTQMTIYPHWGSTGSWINWEVKGFKK